MSLQCVVLALWSNFKGPAEFKLAEGGEASCVLLADLEEVMQLEHLVSDPVPVAAATSACCHRPTCFAGIIPYLRVPAP